MRYFKALEIALKPLIFWNGVANSIEELTSLGLEDDPLVLPESDIPKTIYGVCPLKIVEGQLVQRSVAELETFESEFSKSQILKQQFNLINGVESGTFLYDSLEFPMDARSRILYDAINNITFSIDDGITLMTSDGNAYTLFEANKSDFLDAYYFRLYQLSRSTLTHIE